MIKPVIVLFGIYVVAAIVINIVAYVVDPEWFDSTICDPEYD